MNDLPPTERAPATSDGPEPGGRQLGPSPHGARRIGSLELIELLGSGGMGEVWRARDLELDRVVAVKLMAPELSARDGARRFRREARSAAAINHSHVAQVYFAGEHEGRLFYVMEHVPGRSLERWLRERGRLPVARCLDLMRQAAEGLRAAQRAGVIHRDLKPANLMVDDRWRLKVVDFGLARRELDTTLTRVNAVLGTPTYMAPEQALGREVDHRADIYALGGTFYHLLCGRPPFSAHGALQLAEQHVSAPLPPLAGRNPEVPETVCALVERMLEKDPALRFQSYDELLVALAVARGDEVAVEQARATRWMPWAAAVLALLLAGAAVARLRLGHWPWLAPRGTPAAAAPAGATSAGQARVGPSAGSPASAVEPDGPGAVGDAVLPSDPVDPSALELADDPFPLGALAPAAAVAEGQARDATEQRMREVASALAAFARERHRHARALDELTGYGLGPESLRDAWGTPLALERPRQRDAAPFLVSWGPDRRARTADDLFFVAGRLRSAPQTAPR